MFKRLSADIFLKYKKIINEILYTRLRKVNDIEGDYIIDYR